MRRARTPTVIVVLALVGVTGIALAQGGFFSSSPGELTLSHLSLDDPNHCNDCHVNGTKVVSRDACVSCHKKIDKPTGFHAQVKDKKCETCHHEHKGRSYDLMGWSTIGGEATFDHAVTGWKLEGAHGKTACKDCHTTRDKQGLRTYIGLKRACESCHAKDQPHKITRPKLLDCSRCHGETVWATLKQTMAFNHDDKLDAAMPLLGEHRGVACVRCHAKKVFHLPFAQPTSCGNAGCHQSPHDGHLFGTRPCEWCHSPTFGSLAVQRFDHSAMTRFDLGGPRHTQLPCERCHTKALGTVKPAMACEQCHAKDSHHGDRFAAFGAPAKCGTCHQPGAPTFTPSAFNHGAKTRFKLEYKHAEQACRGCHRGTKPSEFERFAFDPNKECMSCHQHASVHEKQYTNKQCLTCHLHPGDPTMRQGKENEVVLKAHGPKGTFPLTRGHCSTDKQLIPNCAPASQHLVPCGDCHTGRNEKGKTTFLGLKQNCKPCHEDSLHRGTLGENCLGCHVSGEFKDAIKFDHDLPFPADARSTLPAYPLKGEHKTVRCEQCHPKREFVQTAVTCSAEGCHLRDDAHKGRLGTKCEQCHLETRDNIFNHNTMSAFKLDGKHLQVKCIDCHPSVTFKPRPTDCFGCHPEPAVHKGQYGTGCAQCHTTRTWGDVKPLHDVGDFSLDGMHGNIACERCHRDNRPLAGAGNLCINCHRQDDVHNNSLSPRCGECHTQWSFAPARFDHGRVGCNLTGLHRTIACFDCHRNGNFAALSPICVSCHHDDGLRVGVITYLDAMNKQQMIDHTKLTTCAGCHNPNTWSGARGDAPTGFDRESVCR